MQSGAVCVILKFENNLNIYQKGVYIDIEGTHKTRVYIYTLGIPKARVCIHAVGTPKDTFFNLGPFCIPDNIWQFLEIKFHSVQLLSRVWICSPRDCSTPAFHVHHQLLELAQTHVCWVSDATLDHLHLHQMHVHLDHLWMPLWR